MSNRAVFPGSFDPLTVAHLAIADAVHAQLEATAVDLAISRVALGKEDVSAPVADRVAAIRRHGPERPWLDVVVTEAQLIADIARGYDVLVIGADKWPQLLDSRFYGGSDARDAALARLPRIAVAPRAGATVPPAADVHVLELPDDLRRVSSTAVREGRHDWRA